MSHPKEEAGVEAEMKEVEAEEEEEEQHKDLDSKELAEDSLPSGETGNREAVQEEEDKSMTKVQNVKKARVNTKTPNMDKDRCLKYNEFGHWAKDCPQNQNGAQQKTFPGAQYNYMYPMVPQVPMAPVAMPSNGIQVPMQGPNTAVLGQMTDVMMQLNEVELQDKRRSWRKQSI